MPTAIVTGASRGLGLALSRALAERGWRLVIDAREAGPLEAAAAQLPGATPIPGDVSDPSHRHALVQAAGGEPDLLVNNASLLGPSPQPALADYPLDVLEQVYRVNVLAPLALIQLARPRIVVNVTSDAAVEPYEGWGGYGSSKAALEQLTAILAAEQPQRRVYAIDPGDMNTRMHQEAFPGEDISDRSDPEERVPALLALIEGDLPSGRYSAGELLEARASVAAFELTPANEASAPPAERDAVRLLVAQRGRPLVHDMFRGLPAHLRAGDLLVVNTSATIPAALSAGAVDVHLSTPLPKGDRPDRWVVELRRCGARYRGGRVGDRLPLPGGGSAELLAPYLSPGRLWIAALNLPRPLEDYLTAHGRPIAYAHLAEPRPLEDLQTVFADEPGSAEMPSAGRPFSQRVLDDLFTRGVQVAPLTLHTGVSSLEVGERPYPERYRVPALTASRVNAHRAAGGRVIAVGTTVVRALETVAGPRGQVAPGAGWTSVVVTPERGVRAVDGLLTGWHEPDASHLLMLEAVGGRELIERSYAAALGAGYRWHEFGDTHLILR